ncbi:beta-ketoacyl synthase chain length factor [Pseudomonadota bacterium]
MSDSWGKCAKFSIAEWHGIAGGIESKKDWTRWAKNEYQLQTTLPDARLDTIPPQIKRRLDGLGRCIMSASEQCIAIIKKEPAVISVSRHGNLRLMSNLIQHVRDQEDISPASFAHSVHNRFSSLISIVAGYHGVNAAYSSVGDGFPVALAEATALIEDSPRLSVLLLAYEPEIPKEYKEIVSNPWVPHVAVFVLQAANNNQLNYSISRQTECFSGSSERGTCFPLLRTMLNKTNERDGFWEYQRCE